MTALTRLVDFYRAQAELIWSWRTGRRRLLRRALVSFAVAFVALGATAVLLPGLRVDSPLSLAAAVVVIGALSALVRPILLGIVVSISPILVLLASLAFQVLVMLAVAPIVPGFRITGVTEAFIASWVFALINSFVTWLLSLDSDESYYAILVRRLVAARPDVIRTEAPGVVIVQIDGLPHPVLRQQIQAGRVPVMSRWLRSGEMTLSSWNALLPSQTSASQAGIMYGCNDDIPAFRWWDKTAGRLFVSNHPADAARLDASLRANGGVLAGGASIGNLCTGGAERSYLTMATINNPAHGLGRSQAYFSFFLSPYAYAHAIVLGLGEVVKEYVQSRRAAAMGVEPRLPRRFPYPLLRALTNVVLRPLCTSLVIEEMLRGTPTIYVTYTDYDEIAHYSGPQRAESLDALDGVDRVLGTLQRAAQDAPRPYHFVVLSDHGQSLGATFRQRFGHSLEEVVRRLMGGPESVVAATMELEQWGPANAFLSEVGQAGGRTGRLARRTLERGRPDRAAERELTGTGPSPVGNDRLPELAVCASGNLALIFFPRLSGRVTLEELDELYPDLVEALANHPGVGLLMVRSDARGTIVAGGNGARSLRDDSVTGRDPLAPFGDHAAAALRRLDAMSNCGDIVLISVFDVGTEEVAAFEELIGSHGGLGGPQTEPFLLRPAGWQVTEELVGAPAVGRQLRAWVDAVGSRSPASPAEAA